MTTKRLKKYSPLVLRLGIALVFLWFGFSQLKDASNWTKMVPEYVTGIASAETLVYTNGIFEIIFATLLLLGLYTRTASFFLSIHILHITTIVGYGGTGARDLAITLATFAIFLNGADEFCLDELIEKRKMNKNQQL